MDKLQQAFEYARKEFFPRWDRKNEWTIEYRWDAHFQGKADGETKTIIMNLKASDSDEFYQLLIHEISHAASHDCHGKKWQARYRKASERAKELGRQNLAALIIEDADNYADPDKCIPSDAKSVYEKLCDCLVDAPHVSYENLIDFLAWEYGLTTEAFHQKYKRSKEFYIKKRKEVLSWKEAMEKWEVVK